MFQLCAIPPVIQNSIALEAFVPGTQLDLSQTETGNAYYICSETGGVNGVTVAFQCSNDGVNWFTAAVTGSATQITAGQTTIFTNNGNGLNLITRFIRLSLKDTIAGSHGTLKVSGGHAK